MLVKGPLVTKLSSVTASEGIETVSPEGTFCDTVQVHSSADDMELH